MRRPASQPDFVTVAGFLDAYETGTGYRDPAGGGRAARRLHADARSGEVAEIFEVPLAFLLDPKNRERQSREWQGRAREFYAYQLWSALYMGRDGGHAGQFQRKAGRMIRIPAGARGCFSLVPFAIYGALCASGASRRAAGPRRKRPGRRLFIAGLALVAVSFHLLWA